MVLKDVFNPVATLGARLCEVSGTFRAALRNSSFRGKERIVTRIRSDRLNIEMVANCQGANYKIDLRDDVQREFFFNVFERQELELALGLIPQGGTCIDIGANVGIYALQFAKKAGIHGKVYAFEPDPANFVRLSTNCSLNDFGKIVDCRQMAVSEKIGMLTFFRSDAQHSGWGSLVHFGDIARESSSVQTTTLDEFVDSERLLSIDLLKIDVEAHEPELLKGASRSLAAHKFKNVLMEINGIRLSERGMTPQDVLDPLDKAGYEPGDLNREILAEIRTNPRRFSEAMINVLFKPRAS